MNDPMIIAAAFVMVIASIGATIVQVINAKAAADDRREAKIAREKLLTMAEMNDEKTNKVIEQGVAIHTLTNSNLSKVTADLATATATIQSLERMIASLTKAKEIADNLTAGNKGHNV